MVLKHKSQRVHFLRPFCLVHHELKLILKLCHVSTALSLSLETYLYLNIACELQLLPEVLDKPPVMSLRFPSVFW